jgi:hypothetical protein
MREVGTGDEGLARRRRSGVYESSSVKSMCDREAEAEVSPTELEVDVTREDDLLGIASGAEVVSGIGARSAVGSGVGIGGGEVNAAVDAMDILREWGWCEGIELEP